MSRPVVSEAKAIQLGLQDREIDLQLQEEALRSTTPIYERLLRERGVHDLRLRVEDDMALLFALNEQEAA